MKPLPGIVFAVLLAGTVGGVLLQRNALSNARLENHKLRGESEEVRRLAGENQDIARLRAENQEIEKLRLETRDLHKLRNEVHQLRERKPGLEKLRAENERLRRLALAGANRVSKVTEAGKYIAVERCADVGLGSPASTLQTFLWALREKNTHRLLDCFSGGNDTQSNELPGNVSMEDLKMTWGRVKAILVTGEDEVSADNIQMELVFVGDPESGSGSGRIGFKRVGNDWKFALPP